MRRISLAFAILAVSFGTASAKAPPKPIAIPNAEDLFALPDSEWVLAGSMAGGPDKPGALYAVNSKTAKPTKLYPRASGASARRADGCGNELTPDSFEAHGISFVPGEKGAGVLYVINHRGRESVEIFDLTPGKNASTPPSVTWRGCVVAPEAALMNSIAALPSGAFYVTATPDAATKSASLGDVRSWSADKGWGAVFDSEMAYSNGIVASPSGDRLYVSAWGGGRVIELTLGDKPTRRALPLGFMPDNLRWGSDGKILAAGHAANSRDGIVACFNAGGETCPVKSYVARIDPATFTLDCQIEVGANFSTTAVIVRDQIWLGTARGAYINRLPASALNCPAR